MKNTMLKALLANILASLVLIQGTFASDAHGAQLMHSGVYQFAYGGDPNAVSIEVSVFDNYAGDYTKYHWVYVVTNNSYNPYPGPFIKSNGFSSIIMYLDYVSPLEITDLEQPAGWVTGFQYPLPINWDIVSQNGIMPSQSGAFSFTTEPREFATVEGYFSTWFFGSPVEPVYFDSGQPIAGPGALLSRGACCSPADWSCSMRTEQSCSASGGGYLGDGVECSGQCQPPSCNDDSDCEDGDIMTFGYCVPGIGQCVQVNLPEPLGDCDNVECALEEFPPDPCTVDFCINDECEHVEMPCCEPELECYVSCLPENACQMAVCVPLSECVVTCVLLDLDCLRLPLDRSKDFYYQIVPPGTLRAPVLPPLNPTPVYILGNFTMATVVGGYALPLAPMAAIAGPSVMRAQPGVDFALATSPSFVWRITASEGLALPAYAEFQYADEDILDGVEEGDIAVYQYGVSGWEMRYSRVDSVGNTVTTWVDRLGLFSLGVRDGVAAVPGLLPATVLHDAVPNPFNPCTTIAYELPAPGAVRLTIFDAKSRLVRRLAGPGMQAAGRHEAVWDGRSDSGKAMPSGVYFCRLEAGDHVQTIKLALLK